MGYNVQLKNGLNHSNLYAIIYPMIACEVQILTATLMVEGSNSHCRGLPCTRPSKEPVDDFRVQRANGNLDIGRELGLHALAGHVDGLTQTVAAGSS